MTRYQIRKATTLARAVVALLFVAVGARLAGADIAAPKVDTSTTKPLAAAPVAVAPVPAMTAPGAEATTPSRGKAIPLAPETPAAPKAAVPTPETPGGQPVEKDFSAPPTEPVPVAPMAPMEPRAPMVPAAEAPGEQPEAAQERPAPAEPKESLRLRYSVTMYGDDNATPHAPENMVFSIGSQYKLVVTPDRDVYLYLIREDAAGRFFLINPAPGIATSVDRLKGGMDHVLPLGAWFQVSALAGVERIHVIASPHRVERMELLVEHGVAGTHDSPAIKAALQAALKEVSPDYETHKRVNGQWSELGMTGEPYDKGVMVGVIDMRCQ